MRLQGHDCICFAINDHHLKPVVNENVLLRGSKHFRFSRQISWNRRIELLQNAVTEFQPDWVSLQFVPYGYSPRGLPLLLPFRLASLKDKFKWHIMFHELWIEPQGGGRHQIVSLLQKFVVSKLFQKLAPDSVHTSNYNYQAKLEKLGFSATILPLFSNIERATPNPILRQELLRRFDSKLVTNEVWIFVFFGSIYPGWNFEEFLKRTSDAARKAKKKASLFCSIGKKSGRGADIWNAMQDFKSESLIFHEIGEMSAFDISRHLQSADFGVSTTPLSLLGKSGSLAAIASHGITTIVPRVDVSPVCEVLEKLGIVLMDEFFEQGLLNPPKPRECHLASEIADLLLRQLQPLFKTP